MFKEVLKIEPQVTSSDLSKMEKSLGARFKRIAKGFGKGLTAVLTGGGVAGLAIGLIDKILNPLKEVQDAIERTLQRGDDVATNAKQFGTTTGKLFKLQQLGQASGLEPGQLDVLLGKFQTAVAEARQDPSKQTAVRAFTDEKDTAEGFFKFIQSLQAADETTRTLAQNEVFGEKQTLKMAEFLQADFPRLIKEIGDPNSEKFGAALDKLQGLSNLDKILKVRAENEDLLTKSRLVTADTIKQSAELDKVQKDRENQNIANAKNLQTLSLASQRIQEGLEYGISQLGSLIVKVTDLVNISKKIVPSRLLRSIFGGDE